MLIPKRVTATVGAVLLLGLGGTVLKTNVDVERAPLIQSALAAAPSGSGA